MPLSRSLFTNTYGDLQRMMEATESHGGYGDMTWKVGPHAGDQPYGGNHGVVFVDRNELLANAHPPETGHDVERHANDIGQQMERGDVINVPHVQVKGGKFHLHPEHHGALQAAAKRGAAKVPVVVNKQDGWRMKGLPGGAEKPGAHGGKDPDFKWRWNGKGWYTKPSFNDGRCPQGTSASQSDQCLGAGGGPEPGSMAAPKKKDAGGEEEFPGDAVNSSLVAPAPRRIQPRAIGGGGGGRRGGGGGGLRIRARVSDRQLYRQINRHVADGDMMAAAAAFVQHRPDIGPRGAIRGLMDLRKKAENGGYADEMAPPTVAPPKIDPKEDPGVISKGDVERHSGVAQKQGLGPSLNAGAAGGGRRRIQEAVKRLKQIAPEIEVDQSKRFGSGASGVVHPANPKDGRDMVVKFDKGPNEATMARLAKKYPDIGGLASVPDFDSVYDTGLKGNIGEPIFAIYREDLHDPSHEHKMFFGAFGNSAIDTTSWGAHGKSREELLASFHRKVKEDEWRERAYAMDDHTGQQFDRVVADVSHMIKRGIIPCDTHRGNWGVRPGTGEIVMRDMGCSNFASDVHST